MQRHTLRDSHDAASGRRSTLKSVIRLEITVASMIIGQFEARRSAELAIERIVQEYGVPRDDVVVQPAGPDNTAGTRPAGADVKAAPEPEGQENLNGPLQASVKLSDADSEPIVSAMKAAGATAVRNT